MPRGMDGLCSRSAHRVVLSLPQEPSPGGDHSGMLPFSGQCSLLFYGSGANCRQPVWFGGDASAFSLPGTHPPHKHLLFLVLPRPRRSDACPEAAAAAFLPGEVMGTGSSAGLKGLLCLGPFSEMLPWEESEEVDSVHEAYREGIFESERLDFLFEMEKKVS